ncbi:sodium-dependent transporter [Paenibacillus sp. ACRRX]|uniref:sodium-dependent transporter n=1 Tax=unclassified Paenibacillus TaxID=185978 RepID=UPI001EF6B11F|nr:MULTISPECIES: sodium-dependent transporter [unclassified Paenibacillus]MCG7406001.1 sodium-dependent transporter [Paenibacillus sp. ACRRX]MDK8182454.1 sodium-dependent transporter [Paenibacillus sp. UMB4589-SE434]
MKNEQWTSKIGFILASAGSAIGLGAIWKFPNVVATSGGGAFFLVFLLFTLGIGLPLLLAEFVIGRSTGKEAVSAYKDLAPKSRWHWIGYLGMATCSILLSFYSVVGGWIVLYFIKALTGQLLHHGEDYGVLFQTTTSDPYMAVLSQAGFMLLTILIVARGVKGGIEKASRIMMPGLFIIFVILMIRSLTLPGMGAGLTYFLKPDFSRMTSEAVLYALGQSFFCLSVGGSCMVTYSSYLGKKDPLGKPALTVVGLNLMTSLMAGIAIFPALFALGMKPADGPGLLFITLPAMFEKLPYGTLFIAIFLALFLFATLTSAFSLLEIVVAAFAHGEPKRRRNMCWLFGTIIFLLGVPSALSFGMEELSFMGKTVFEWADFAVTNVMLPLGVLLISVFVGYRYPKERLQTEWSSIAPAWRTGLRVYLFMLRFVLPIIVLIVFLNGMKWLPL